MMAQREETDGFRRQLGLGLLIVASLAACSKTGDPTSDDADVGFAAGETDSQGVPNGPRGDAGADGATGTTANGTPSAGTPKAPGGTGRSDDEASSGGAASAAGSSADASGAGGTSSTPQQSAGGGATQTAGGVGSNEPGDGGSGGNDAGSNGAAGVTGNGGAGGAPLPKPFCRTFPETDELEERVVCQEPLNCPVGEGWRVDVDYEARTFTQSCVPCGAGAYKDRVGADSCFPCRLCGTLGVSAECTATSNTACEHSGAVAQFGIEQLNLFFGGVGAGTSGAWVAGFLAEPDGGDNAGAYVGHVASDGAIERVEEYPISQGDERLRAVAVPDDGSAWVGGIRDIGGYEGVIRRYLADGTSHELESLRAGQRDQVQVEHMALDEQGNLWAAGITNGLLRGAHLGSYDLFFAKYAAPDAEPKIVQFGGPGTDYMSGFALDASGTPWIVGHFSTSIPDDPQSMAEPFLGRVETDADLGSVSLVPLVSLDANLYLMDIALDSAGAPAIIARPRSNEPLSDEGVYLVRKYDTEGNIVFSDYIGTEGEDWLSSMLVDDQDRIWVGGSTSCNMTDAELPGVTPSASNDCSPRQRSLGNEDLFVRIYAPDGSASETHQFGSPQYDTLEGMASSNGSVWVAGITGGALGSVRRPGYNQAFVWQLEL